nr:hypothetical protein [Tanacetum cinerariifolium]
MLVPAQEEELGNSLTMPFAPQHIPIIQPSTSKPQKKQKPRKQRRQDTKLPLTSVPKETAIDEADNEEMGKDTMGDTIAQTRSKNVSKQSNNPPLSRVNTLRSGEDSLKLKEFMEICTNFQQRVVDLENTNTVQA